MSDHKWKQPWLNLARFLNVLASHTVAAIILMAILNLGQYVIDAFLHATDTVWLKGTSHQFDASDLFHASDLAIIFLFIGFGILHGFEELKK